MQGFINTEYYVECNSHEEIVEFLQMCMLEGLTMRSGKKPDLCAANRYGNYATFAHNYRDEHDGISSWSTMPSHSDHKRPHVLFPDFLANNQLNQQNNASSILDLL